MLNKSQIVCPKCQRADAVRKVSAVVAEGTQVVESSGAAYVPAKHGSALIPVAETSVSRSALAAKLAPPRKPAKPFGYGCVAVLLMTRLGLALLASITLLALFLCSYPFMMNVYLQNNALFIAILVIGIVLIGLMGVLTVRSGWRDARSTGDERNSHEPRMQAWERACDRWQQLYYCQRDDGVFIPGHSTFVPVEKMDAYLYSESKRKRRG